MRPTTLGALAGSTLLSLIAQPVAATSGHRHLHIKHSENHTHRQDSLPLAKRGKLVNRAGQCAFPDGEGLVTITPSELNHGWAMSPDQECTADSYCPYACPPGQLMNQWEPGSSYVYPSSMAGGLYCDKNGKITKPFPNEAYCVDGIGNVEAVNNCGDHVAICQTVLPGNEAMLIPTSVSSNAIIAVPGTSYWDATASHFYVNPPGYSTDEACIWGDGTKPIGNWAAYVIGANQDATGNTYVKLGYNPIYTDAYAGVKPTFGLKIECDGDCVGLPCVIDPGTDSFGVVESLQSATGAGGADFCVVTVTSGSARIVIFNTDGSTGDSSAEELVSSSADPEPAPSPTTTAEPTTSKDPVVVVGFHAQATTSTSTTSSTTHSTTTTSSSSTEDTTAPSHEATTSKDSSTSSTSKHRSSTTTFHPTTTKPAGHGGIFQENDVSTNSTTSSGPDTTPTADPAGSTTTAPAATTSSKSNASKDQAAFAGLVVAIVAAACLY